MEGPLCFLCQCKVGPPLLLPCFCLFQENPIRDPVRTLDDARCCDGSWCVSSSGDACSGDASRHAAWMDCSVFRSWFLAERGKLPPGKEPRWSLQEYVSLDSPLNPPHAEFNHMDMLLSVERRKDPRACYTKIKHPVQNLEDGTLRWASSWASPLKI